MIKRCSTCSRDLSESSSLGGGYALRLSNYDIPPHGREDVPHKCNIIYPFLEEDLLFCNFKCLREKYNTWYPMSTAPTDGTQVLVRLDNDAVTVAHWDGEIWQGEFGEPVDENNDIVAYAHIPPVKRSCD